MTIDQYDKVAANLDTIQKAQVQKSRELEDTCLSLIKEALGNLSDGRWCSIAITDIEKAFMSVRKAITTKSR